MTKDYNNELLNDCAWFAEKHRGKNKQLGPHWSTIIRFTPLFDEAARLQQRVDTLEAYIDDCQSKPCYANKKEEARKKINDILAHALTERKEDYYLDGKYFRWGKLEKDIMEVVDNIFVDGGNENAK
jgi:hypothetical protein